MACAPAFRPTLLAAAALAALGAPPALAQAPGSATGTQLEALEEIIVTARRRSETLQETPLAVTAITPTQLESKATLNIGDLMGSAPNVLITQQNSGAAAANVSIRGLSFADVEKSFDPTVAIVVDGVFIGTSTGAFLDFFDIDSIEVLRGPQGTLFGRNTIGGVINIRRSRPTGENGGKLEFSYGKYNTWATRAILNTSLIQDKLAAKFFYFHNESDGYYRQGITGKRVGGNNNENFGASFLLTPTENFEALLTLEKQVQDFEPVNSNISKTGEVFCAFVPANQCNRNTRSDLYTVFNSPAHSNYKSPAATLEMNLDTDGIDFTSVTGYRTSDEAQTQDFDASSADLYYTNRIQDYWQFSQELRGAGNLTDSFDYVIGGFYYESKFDLFQATRLFGAVNAAADQYNTGRAKSYAVFGDFNWKLADQWRLSGGARWTHDEKQQVNRVGPAQYPNAKYSGSKFTPKVVLDYRPDDDNMLYASWSRGYRSGGFSSRGQTLVSSTTPFGPETVDSYEAGIKSALLENRLQVNLAGYVSDYSDLQQNTTIPTTIGTGNETIVTNVGSAKIKGIELDVTARISYAFKVTASLGIQDSKFSGFITSAPNAAGRLVRFDYSDVKMIYSPDLTGSLTAEYTVPLDAGDLVFSGSYRYIGDYDQQISLGATQVDAAGNVKVLSNDPRVRSDKQNLFDASATFNFDVGDNKGKVTLYGRNLFDDRGPNAAFTVAGLWSFSSGREPRTYGISLGYEF
ncbi:TonB-dependent receptor [Niveispirillum lacus]|uniref:TonB-dependent receptor n=1 Tax=Niveispirillum lacus TaxID=1981099 RepID=A0A255Z065_9PROT|nr:TonB-dependent receptor [Niveispirillum lacus]OYQ34305.1 TonB-dependent receptor [Niveispirillum lacus]